MNIELDYTPQPKQQELHASPANEVLFGGAAGPGKSHALRFEVLKWALLIPGLQAYIFRRTLPELEKNHILPSLQQFPRDIGRYRSDKNRWHLHNGSIIFFGYCQYEKDVFSYQGAEIHILAIDELTTFSEFIYDYLRGRTRTTLDIPPQFQHKIPGIYTSSNPGGVGHAWVKRRWIDTAKPYQCKRAPDDEGGMLRQYIPGRLQDNPILLERDPNYINRLNALPEPYRTAYMDGDWNIFLGQMFEFNSKDHVIKPIPIPDTAPLYMTLDLGFARPYSVGWWWFDEDGRAYRFAELYGCMPNQPDTGLRQGDDEIAEEIAAKEQSLGIDRPVIRIAPPDAWAKKPDYVHGGQSPSTAATFARHGITLQQGNPDRVMKIRQFHARLRVPRDDRKNRIGTPMLQVYDCCADFIRTIPLLQSDPNKPEDVDKKLEDHIYDEAALMFMTRPLKWVQGMTDGSLPPDSAGMQNTGIVAAYADKGAI
jgi:hypothetical protein